MHTIAPVKFRNEIAERFQDVPADRVSQLHQVVLSYSPGF